MFFSKIFTPNWHRGLSKISLIISDIDGVLTDGRIRLSDDGHEIKAFSCKDGPAIKLARAAGIKVLFITGRPGPAVKRRCEEMGVDLILKKDFETDISKFSETISKKYGVEKDAMIYIGDDLGDVLFMKAVGTAAAPRDSAEEALAAASLITKALGGQGVLAEVIREILRSKGVWEKLLSTTTLASKN